MLQKTLQKGQTPGGVNLSITFYTQLLQVKIPNLKKNYNFTFFFVLLGSTRIKAARKTLMKLTPGVNLSTTFYTQLLHVQNPMCKKYSQAISLF